MAQITYRYSPDRAGIAFKHCEDAHNDFVDYYGTDMKVFKDGQALAEAEQNRLSENRNRDKLGPEIAYPDYILHGKSVAIFSDPIESSTVFTNFDKVERFLNGETDDASRFYEFLSCPETPPSGVQHLIDKYGTSGISKAFMIDEKHPGDLVCNYALRCMKGQFYRKRFPHITLV